MTKGAEVCNIGRNVDTASVDFPAPAPVREGNISPDNARTKSINGVNVYDTPAEPVNPERTALPVVDVQKDR